MAQLVDIDSVLDAAREIVLNDGFEAASLRAIATRASLSNDGLLELFSTPGQLFVSMLNREYGGIFMAIVDQMERDPLGGRLSHIYRHTIAAVHERPLAKMLYLSDPRALNAIMRDAYGFDYMPPVGLRTEFIDMMKDAGMVRRDVDSAAISAVVSAVSAGAALTAPHDQLDGLIEGLAMLLERSVDTDVADTLPGKTAFVEYATILANAKPSRDR